jgi:hypothetical protein
VIGVLAAAGLAVTAAGVFALATAPVHGWYPALRLALEFWIGAGLLHLSASSSWSALGVAAAVIGVRALVQLAGPASSDRLRRG